MKSEKIFEAIGMISDEKIEKANQNIRLKQVKNTRFRSLYALAATLVLVVVGAAALIFMLNGDELPIDINPPYIEENHPEMPTPVTVKIGDIIEFGDYDWRVLDVRDDKALIITEKVIESRPYHSSVVGITWEHSDIREYLNGEFYDSFGNKEKQWILNTDVVNDDNPVFGTDGGNNTLDKIFLLSIEEARTYFANDTARIAFNTGSETSWWYNPGGETPWKLRSPGVTSGTVAYVYIDGVINAEGDGNIDHDGGMRPAMWITANVAAATVEEDSPEQRQSLEELMQIVDNLNVGVTGVGVLEHQVFNNHKYGTNDPIEISWEQLSVYCEGKYVPDELSNGLGGMDYYEVEEYSYVPSPHFRYIAISDLQAVYNEIFSKNAEGIIFAPGGSQGLTQTYGDYVQVVHHGAGAFPIMIPTGHEFGENSVTLTYATVAIGGAFDGFSNDIVTFYDGNIIGSVQYDGYQDILAGNFEYQLFPEIIADNYAALLKIDYTFVLEDGKYKIHSIKLNSLGNADAQLGYDHILPENFPEAFEYLGETFYVRDADDIFYSAGESREILYNDFAYINARDDIIFSIIDIREGRTKVILGQEIDGLTVTIAEVIFYINNDGEAAVVDSDVVLEGNIELTGRLYKERYSLAEPSGFHITESTNGIIPFGTNYPHFFVWGDYDPEEEFPNIFGDREYVTVRATFKTVRLRDETSRATGGHYIELTGITEIID